MNTTMRIVFAALSLLLTLTMLVTAVWSVTMAFWGVTFVAVLLTGVFGFFVFHDYQFFFGKKSSAATKENK